MTQAADHSSTRVPLAANLGLPPGKTDAIYFDDQVIGFSRLVAQAFHAKPARAVTKADISTALKKAEENNEPGALGSKPAK